MAINWSQTLAAVWRPQKARLRAVASIDPIRLDALVGIDRQKRELIDNTERFLAGRPANNALLWGHLAAGTSVPTRGICEKSHLEVFQADNRNSKTLLLVRETGFLSDLPTIFYRS